MSEAKFGGVTVRFNEDGTLFIYQPDSNRVLGQDLAEQLAEFLAERIGLVPLAPWEAALLQQDGSDFGPVPEPDTFIHTRGPLVGQPIADAVSVQPEHSSSAGDAIEPQLTPLADVAEEFGVDLEALASEPDDDGLTESEREADLQARLARLETRAEPGKPDSEEPAPAPIKRRPGRPRRNG
jgi:hypothetical protein